jgi:hypothetical protein
MGFVAWFYVIEIFGSCLILATPAERDRRCRALGKLDQAHTVISCGARANARFTIAW